MDKIRVFDISGVDDEFEYIKKSNKVSDISKLGKTKITDLNESIADLNSSNKPEGQQPRKKHLGLLILCGFMKEVSIGGCKYVGDISINIFRRLIWLIIVLAALGGMVYMINLNVAYFVTRPTSTKVENVYVDNLKFPAVTICNYNMARKGPLISEDIIAYNMIKEMFPVQFGEETTPNFTGTSFDGFDMASFREYYGHQKEDMIYRCKWKGQTCSYDNFTLVPTDFDSCFTFNSKENGEELYSDSAGSRFGLSLILNAEESEYMNGPFESVGFKLFLGEQSEIPLVSDFGFAVSPGQETVARIKMNKIKRLEAPYGNCGTKDLKYFNDTKYSYGACILECQTDYAVDQCGCKEYYMPGSSRNCHPPEIYDCFLPSLGEFAQLGTSFCDCKIPCEIIQYTPSLSYAVFPDPTTVEYLNGYNVTENYIRKNLAKVEIFFEEIGYELREQQIAYSANSLFSDVGGSLGLLVGSSVITVLEILDFIFISLARAF